MSFKMNLQQASGTLKESSNSKKLEHQFLSTIPDIIAIESDLTKLLNDFNNNRIKNYGINDNQEKLFNKMDSIREKQEKIAQNHFDQDFRLTESRMENEENKGRSIRDLEDLTRQLGELNSSIHELRDFNLDF